MAEHHQLVGLNNTCPAATPTPAPTNCKIWMWNGANSVWDLIDESNDETNLTGPNDEYTFFLNETFDCDTAVYVDANAGGACTILSQGQPVTQLPSGFYQTISYIDVGGTCGGGSTTPTPVPTCTGSYPSGTMIIRNVEFGTYLAAGSGVPVTTATATSTSAHWTFEAGGAGSIILRNVGTGDHVDANPNGGTAMDPTLELDDEWLLSSEGAAFALENRNFVGGYLDANADPSVYWGSNNGPDNHWEFLPTSCA